uniref:Col_cuticle_N domain-containing protein n=1 Tax=Caenorhabditis tropicalis TaxID=1561998 RepID=A0A1I7T157_9PELO
MKNQRISKYEEARRILDNAIPSPTVASPFNNNGSQSMSVSVALVLIVSLISVALLITGIIIIAVTLDPTSNSEEDEESDLEIDEPSSQPKRKGKQLADSNSYYPRFDYDFNNSTTILSEL